MSADSSTPSVLHDKFGGEFKHAESESAAGRTAEALPFVPYYQDDLVTIYHGDCLDVFCSLGWYEEARIITDPPYGFGAYPTDISPDHNLIARWVRSNPTVALFGYPEVLVSWCVRAGVEPTEWVTWWPTNKFGGRTRLLPRESEHVAVFGEMLGAKRLTRPRTNSHPMLRAKDIERGNDPDNAYLGDVWRDPAPGFAGFNHTSRFHPNEKPLSVMSKLVLLCSDPGDLILDPFMGSGTTLRAAKDLGRHAIGIEIEERYCEAAVGRLGQEVMELSQ